ncbi:MAG: glycosyltransferase [Gordonia paraffinivorans]
MTEPVLSVLTPTFRGGRFLPLALQSTQAAVAAGDVEHIVVDGGSEDGTVELLERSHAVWHSAPDRGQSDALNTALSMSRGRWVGWINCDEYYLSGALDSLVRTVRRIDARSEPVDLVYGDYIEVTPDDQILRLVAQHSPDVGVLRRFGLALPSSTVVMRRSLVEQVGGWNVENRTMMDWELWLSLLEAGARFRYSGRAHTAFTRHDDQASARLAAIVEAEHQRLGAQFGIRAGRMRDAATRARRVTRKAANGSYRREVAFRSVVAGPAIARDAAVLREPIPAGSPLRAFILAD